MSAYHYNISVSFDHEIRFTHGAFERDNVSLGQVFTGAGQGTKLMVFVEDRLLEAHPYLETAIAGYFAENCPYLEFIGLYVEAGGEAAKNDLQLPLALSYQLSEAGIDRHSYVLAIGGGAFLDIIGYAAAITHRGVRLVRMPTTVLAQADSGVGVKNGVNAFGQKNFLGAFAVPHAVVNDFNFLSTQDSTERIRGMVEAIKVALVKDGDFYVTLSEKREAIKVWYSSVVEEMIEKSAVLHAEHIAQGGDPFERGSSRPLDFGHWSAHKLEAMSGFVLSHAEAVSIGLALDVMYSVLSGWMEPESAIDILGLLDFLGMPVWTDYLEARDDEGQRVLYEGLEEFRAHLGGELTVLMLHAPGQTLEVHEIDRVLMDEAIGLLQAHCN